NIVLVILKSFITICWENKSHIKSQSQYWGGKSQLDYFPKSFSPRPRCVCGSCVAQLRPWCVWFLCSSAKTPVCVCLCVCVWFLCNPASSGNFPTLTSSHQSFFTRLELLSP